MESLVDTTVVVHLLRRYEPALTCFDTGFEMLYTHNLKDMTPLLGDLAVKP